LNCLYQKEYAYFGKYRKNKKINKMNNQIYPCLWFDKNGREAAELYCSAFKNTSIKSDNQLVVMMDFAGQRIMFLNGGPLFKINPSISFFVICDTVGELDSAWEKLIDGGKVMMPLDKYIWSSRYGWVQDRFGVNWQLSFSEPPLAKQRITPSIMFTERNNGKAEEAINFYTSLFKDSDIVMISRYGKGDNDIEGNVNHAQFRLNGGLFMAMESSMMHKFFFNEGFSFVVECDDQKEIDFFWEKLTEGGEESQCGWLKDRYGISWQIIPSILNQLMSDPAKSERVMNAFLKMRKFDIQKLIDA
jgi:predicted 3-demethylubiquinone-9 3-methyltransferase (glyoxalase superfamily)